MIDNVIYEDGERLKLTNRKSFPILIFLSTKLYFLLLMISINVINNGTYKIDIYLV